MTPEELSVLHYPRVSDAQRDITMAHLRTMHTEGRIGADILDKRLEYAVKAETEHDLEMLTRDFRVTPVQEVSLSDDVYYLKKELTDSRDSLIGISIWVGILSVALFVFGAHGLATGSLSTGMFGVMFGAIALLICIYAGKKGSE